MPSTRAQSKKADEEAVAKVEAFEQQQLADKQLNASLEQDMKETRKSARLAAHVKTEAEPSKTETEQSKPATKQSKPVKAQVKSAAKTSVTRHRQTRQARQDEKESLIVKLRLPKPKLVVKLSLKTQKSRKLFKKAITKTVQQKASIPKPKKVTTKKGFFTNDYRFKFGSLPWTEYPVLTDGDFHEVKDLLINDMIEKGMWKEAETNGPIHAAAQGVTVDAVFQVVMSQATDNNLALRAYATLVETFPVKGVDGKKAKCPDYHAVRVSDLEKFISAIKVAGLARNKGRNFLQFLKKIFEKNRAASNPSCDIVVNPEGATDFVPGSLSLDYMKSMSKEALMDHLLGFDGIGVKTAACLLAFHFGLPVFAVDTHVFRMVKWLNWIPKECNVNDRDDACLHLDTLIPDDIKYELHQAFWKHCQPEVCTKCTAKAGFKEGVNDVDVDGEKGADKAGKKNSVADLDEDGDTTVKECVIEHLLKRGSMDGTPEKKKRKAGEENVGAEKKQKVQKISYNYETNAEAQAAGFEYKAITRETNSDFGVSGVIIETKTVMRWVKKIVNVYGVPEELFATVKETKSKKVTVQAIKK